MTITDTPNIFDAATPTDVLDAADVLLADGHRLVALVADYERRARRILLDLNEAANETGADTTYKIVDGEPVVDDDSWDRAYPGSMLQRVTEVGEMLSLLSQGCGGEHRFTNPDAMWGRLFELIAASPELITASETFDDDPGHGAPVHAIKRVGDHLAAMVPAIERCVVEDMGSVVTWWDEVLSGTDEQIAEEEATPGRERLVHLWDRLALLASVARDDRSQPTGGVVPWFDAFHERRNEEARRQIAEHRADTGGIPIVDQPAGTALRVLPRPTDGPLESDADLGSYDGGDQ